MTRQERLVGLLFPFAVSSIIFLLLTILSGVILIIVKQQQGNVLWWLAILGPLCLTVGGYSGASMGDLRQAYLLIYDKPKGSQTPFDFLTWPTEPQPTWVPILAMAIALLAALALFLTL